jgi:hypothetical protein
MSQLTPNDDERYALVSHFDRICAWRSWCGAKRRRTPVAAAVRRSCLRAADCSQCRPAVGPWMTHRSVLTGSAARSSSQGWSCCHAHRSMPTSRRRPPLPLRMSTAPRPESRSVSGFHRALLRDVERTHRSSPQLRAVPAARQVTRYLPVP